MVATVLCVAVPARAQILDDLTDERVLLEPTRVQKLAKQDRYEAASRNVSAEYTGVAFSARSDASDVQGWIRFRSPDGWGEWMPLYIVRSTVDETVMGGYRSDEVRSAAFEMRFDVEAGSLFEVVGAGVFDNRIDADRSSPGPPRTSTSEKGYGRVEGSSGVV
ncbi:MAG: hypothetical protein R3282_08185, partial [Rhodothermales bacterium]|nr:hypothetical protein [Rhodothermales bacterium]